MEQCRLARRRAGQRRRGSDVPSTVKASSARANERVDEVVDITTQRSGWADGLGRRMLDGSPKETEWEQGYLGLTSLGFGALSVRSGLSQLCEFGSLRLDLCSPLVGHTFKC